MALAPQAAQVSQPAPQSPEQAAPQEAPQEAIQQTQISDDQMKAMFEQMVSPSLEYIYGNGLKDVKASLESFADEPEKGIASIVGRMMSATALKARDQGGMIPPKVMTAIGMELINNVTDIAVQMGLVTEQESNDIGESAFISSLQVFGDTIDDLAISENELNQYMQVVDQIEQLMNEKGGGNPQQQEQPQPEQAPQAQQPQPSSMAQAATGA